MDAVDLRDVPVVDNHCHGILRSQRFDDITSWRRAFTESTDPGMPREHVATTAFYRRLIRTLSSFFDCEPDEETVFTVRTGRDAAELPASSSGPRTSRPCSSTPATRHPKRYCREMSWPSSGTAAPSPCCDSRS